jgi:hypothetical protein
MLCVDRKAFEGRVLKFSQLLASITSHLPLTIAQFFGILAVP